MAGAQIAQGSRPLQVSPAGPGPGPHPGTDSLSAPRGSASSPGAGPRTSAEPRTNTRPATPLRTGPRPHSPAGPSHTRSRVPQRPERGRVSPARPPTGPRPGAALTRPTHLPEGVAEALQEERMLLHVVGERLAQGLDHRGAHGARGVQAPQQLPQGLPPAPPVVPEGGRAPLTPASGAAPASRPGEPAPGAQPAQPSQPCTEPMAPGDGAATAPRLRGC